MVEGSSGCILMSWSTAEEMGQGVCKSQQIVCSMIIVEHYTVKSISSFIGRLHLVMFNPAVYPFILELHGHTTDPMTIDLR